MKQIPLKHGTVVFNQRSPQPTQPQEAGVCAVRPCCWSLPQTGVMCGCRHLAFAITVIITLARRHGSSTPPPHQYVGSQGAMPKSETAGGGETARWWDWRGRSQTNWQEGASEVKNGLWWVRRHDCSCKWEKRTEQVMKAEGGRGCGVGGVELISTPVCRVWRTQDSLSWGCNYGGLGSRGERESHKQIIKTNLNKVTPTGHFIGKHPVGTG